MSTPPSIRLLVGNGGVDRFFAHIIDNIVAFVLGYVVAVGLAKGNQTVGIIIGFTVYLAYFLILESLTGASIGKFSLGLRIRQSDGRKCTFKQCLVRTIFRFFEANPLVSYLPAAIAVIATPRKQRIGDLVAGTVVVSLSELAR
jgi:uncharacterized RDD family membrane protein YckC